MTTSAVAFIEVPFRAAPAKDDPVHARVRLDDLRLDGRRLDAILGDVVLDAEIEATLEGASTVTVQVHDPERRLIRSKVLTRASRLVIDDASYTLRPVDRNGATTVLTFEDTVVSRLKGIRTPKRAFRERTTRQQFIRSMIDDARPRIPSVIPELAVRLPIEGEADVGERRDLDTDRAPGFAPRAALFVRAGDGSRVRADHEQLRIGERVLAVAESLSAPYKARVALVEACMIESLMRNLTHGDGSSVGVLQLIDTHGSVASRRDVERVANLFLTAGFTGRGGAITLAKSNPSWSAGRIAQTCQGSAHPARYDTAQSDAEAWVDAYDGGATRAGLDDAPGFARYEFTRGAPGGPAGEDTWSAAQRLVGEIGWRCWAWRGRVYVMSEEYLMRSRPWLRLDEDDDADVLLAPLDFQFDAGRRTAQIDTRVRAARWTVPPGAVVECGGIGIANGRYIVQSVRRQLSSTEADVVLVKPRPALPEPAPERSSISTSVSSGDVDAAVAAAYERAVEIDRRGFKYSYGGGHDPAITGPYDCSGAVSAILKAAGVIDAPVDTVALGRLGRAGEGQYLTIYVKPFAGRNGHTYAVFNMPGKGEQRFEAHGPSGVGPGGQFVKRGTDPAGYQARHFEGM